MSNYRGAETRRGKDQRTFLCLCASVVNGRNAFRVALALVILVACGAVQAGAQGGPVVSLSATTLSFPTEPLETASPAESLTLTNTGGAALSISSIAIPDHEFKETDNCDGSVAAGASCAISVVFTPFLFGPRSSTLTITDNAPGSPQPVTLTGSGSGPAITLSPVDLIFPPQLVSTTSAASSVTLTNSGSGALTLASITVAGPFAETNNCPSGSTTLAVGASCALMVTFAPLAGGTPDSSPPENIGLIEIISNASPVPAAVSLNGAGLDFALSASPASASISPGQSATYTVTVTPQGGFNQAVSFACVAPPAGTSCSFSPASVTPDGTNPINTTVVVSTTGSAAVPGTNPKPAPPGPWARPVWLGLLLGSLAAYALWSGIRRRRPHPAAAGLLAAILIVTAWTACGGGGGGPNGSITTPAGTYMVLVNGSTPAGSGNLQNPVVLNLTVQ